MKKLMMAVILSAGAGIANAANNEGIYIPFGAMGYDYDNSARDLDSNVMPILGIGYRLNQHIATELMGAVGTTDVDAPGAGQADVQHLRLDGLYFLNSMGDLTPYAVGGAGENRIDYETSGLRDDTFVNAGAGLMYQMTEHLALRGDVRAIHSLDDDNTEAAVNLLLQVSFGGVSKTAEPAPVVPPADNDKDGVVNAADSCPNTPAGKTVDKNGCDCNFTLHLAFDFDSAELRVEDKAALDQVRAALTDLGYARANVVGHTDDQGEEAYNQDLSMRRALAVADYLGANGVNRDMLTPIGAGESQPVTDNSTDEGRAQNRRVVIERTDCGR